MGRRAHRHLEQRAAEHSLRELNDTLEQRIAARTAELEASEARLRTIFETGFQYQGLLSPDGMLLDANRTSLEGIGLRLDQVIGRPLWELPWLTGTPGMSEAAREAVATAAAGQDVRQEIQLNLPEAACAGSISACVRSGTPRARWWRLSRGGGPYRTAAGRGGLAASPEDGGGGPADRRHRP